MVEIDIPGHTAVISKSHPEHVACAEATPWSHFANGTFDVFYISISSHSKSNAELSEPPAGQLRITTQSTVSFTTDLIRAVSSMFPSKLFSTGGDEINMNCYKKDKMTQQDLGV
jgi:hexosaminidase